MADALVQVEGLAYSHQAGGISQQVLDQVAMELRHGEVVVLTGPSGSGKSTLLTIVGGLRRAVTGSVHVFGEELVGAKERALVRLRRRIGFIFQQHNLAPALSIAQNVQMGLQHTGAHRARDARQRIADALTAVGLEDHLHKHPSQLSGGQQQRAGIARALVGRPQLVLADEPTASLDRASGQRVLDLFNAHAADGAAVVLVTHDKRVIDQAHRVVVLEDGRLVPPREALLKDTGNSVRKLMDIDSDRFGRMLSLGHALARVALADGRVDEGERAVMMEALRTRQHFTGPEVELVVDLALAQAKGWQDAVADVEHADELQAVLEAVAGADDRVAPEELEEIRRLLQPVGQSRGGAR